MKRFHKILLIVGILLAVSAVAFGTVYSHGSKVADRPHVQWVSHTEYWNSTGEVSTIVRLTDYRGQPYDVDSCTASILFPDKSFYVQDQAMSESTIAGNWYRTDPHPPITGTYEQEVTCIAGVNIIKTSQSFHVGEALSEIKIISDTIGATDLKLEEVEVTITAQIANSTESLTTTVEESSATTQSLLANVSESISDELSAMSLDTNASLSEVEFNVNANIASSQENISMQINDVETNLAGTLETLETGLNTKLDQIAAGIEDLDSDVAAMQENVTKLVNDVNTLMTLSMAENDDWIADRFDTIDATLASLQDLCGSTETSNAAICLQLDSVEETVNTLKDEQDTYYESLNETLVSGFSLMSAELAEDTNQLLDELGIIKDTTTRIESKTDDINQTISNWIEEEENRIFIQPIA